MCLVTGDSVPCQAHLQSRTPQRSLSQNHNDSHFASSLPQGQCVWVIYEEDLAMQGFSPAWRNNSDTGQISSELME